MSHGHEHFKAFSDADKHGFTALSEGVGVRIFCKHASQSSHVCKITYLLQLHTSAYLLSKWY